MTYTLITGASRGIGRSMAEYCASKGFNLILVARSEDLLRDLALRLSVQYKIKVYTFQADLTEQDSAENIFNFCKINELEVDKLINNAGAGLYGRFEDKSLDEQLSIISIGIHATVRMTHKFIPVLKKNKGYLLNVSSTACYQPIPYMSVYAASQAFLQSFTLGLRAELKRAGVSVSALCPGPTATEFYEKAGMEGLPVNSSEVKMSPDEVARIGIDGLLNHTAEIIPGASNTLGAYFSKLFPNTWIVKTVTGLFAPAN
jgi:uncharacterized protein